MEQNQVLDNLYALRAGLSVISQQYDKAQAIENEADQKLAENAKNFSGNLVCDEYEEYSTLKYLQERYGEYDIGKGKKAFNRWLAYDECDNYFKRVYSDAERDKTLAEHAKEIKARKRHTSLSILFFCLTAVAAAFVSFMFFIFSGSKGDKVSAVITDIIALVIVGGIPLLLFLIFGIVFACSARNDKWTYTRKINDAKDQIMAAQWLLDNLPQAKNNARIILIEKDRKIAPVKESSNSFYMALKNQFSYLLDERDWKNLDLVIYELETRRADTVKEALQLVDRELQTERIQQTIVQATEQICYEIRRGFAELRNTIIECSRVISAQLSAVSLQLEGISGQLAELTDSVNMANALQAKANVTSAQLLSDVHAIRYYQ